MPKHTLKDEFDVAAQMDSEQGDDLPITNEECATLAALNCWYCRPDGATFIACQANHPEARLDLNRAAEALFMAKQTS